MNERATNDNEQTPPAQADEATAAAAAEAGAAPEAEATAPSAREAELEAKVNELEDRILRLLAEQENMRRRHARDVDEARQYAITGFARDLLELPDNLARAMGTIPPDAANQSDFMRNLVEGLAMTERQLLAVLDKHNIARVEPARGDKFDHNRHQAMVEIPTADVAPGTVAEVLQIGYTIGERLLRPALVGVAKAPPQAPAGDAPTGEDTAPGQRIDTSA